MGNAARQLYLACTNLSVINYDDANKYLQKLFGRCEQGYIEIRPIPDSAGLRTWIPLSDIMAPTVPVDKDIYVGVATRQYGKGERKYIVEIPAVWVDIDFNDIQREEVEKRIQEFKLTPSMVVESGHGFHLYWILEAPAASGDVHRIVDINKRLVFHFGGDDKSSEAARILRLPGTYNQKKGLPCLVRLSSINDNTYHIDDFSFLPQPVPPKSSSSGQAQDWYTGLLQGVQQGNRTNAAMRLLGRYIEKRLTENEAGIVLSQWNEHNMPPLPDEELERTIVDAYGRYGQRDDDFVSIIEKSVIDVPKFMKESFPEPPCIIASWLHAGEIALISAGRGVGKTWLAMSIGIAATRPYTIGRWKTGTPTGCLYIDGEMAVHSLQARLLKLQMGQAEVAPFRLLSSKSMRSCGKSAPKLTDRRVRDWILDYLRRNPDLKLLILDNLACLTPGLDENAKKDWDAINQWFLDLRSNGVSAIAVHHAGKDGVQRGTSAREDSIDISIKLTRPVGYSSEEGARFNVEFTKGREREGDDVKPFGLSLKKAANGVYWEENAVESRKAEEIIKMLQEGVKQKDIAKELGVSTAYVSQIKKRAEEEEISNGSNEQVKNKQGALLKQALEEFGRMNEKLLEEPCSQEEEHVEVPCGEEVKENN